MTDQPQSPEPSGPKSLSGRREFLFLYDIKMGNPNGDPDENRPRVLPDGTHYITDVRLKRFVRDFLKSRAKPILVDNIEGRTTNLTGRVAHHLKLAKKKLAQGKDLVNILLDDFVDARLFGSSLAFKTDEVETCEGPREKWEVKPEPKTLTGALQINMGEVLHKAEEVDIHGTSVFASSDDKAQGTFTTYFALRYGLIGFSGVANEHSARLSRMTDADYDLFLEAAWNGVRACGNTRTKRGQMPHLLISVEYIPNQEFQFGRLQDYVKLKPALGKPEKAWAGPGDFTVDLSLFLERIGAQRNRIALVRYCKSPDVTIDSFPPAGWKDLGFDACDSRDSQPEVDSPTS